MTSDVVRVRANLFGISFGFAGLAQAWGVGHATTAIPKWPADGLSLVAAAAWLVTSGLFLATAGVKGVIHELADPTYGPFVSLGTIVPMPLGVTLARHERIAGEVIFTTALTATLLLGGWLFGQWVLADVALERWHPGYFLPTVAGGLLAAEGCAALGHMSLARLVLGYGIVSWLALGSVLLARVFTEPMLPVPLRPTLAIQLAPPVVAGVAWFDLNGGAVDTVGLLLVGYAVLMALMQLRLAPVYAKVPFGPGWWAFSFSYAAAFTDAIRWLAAEHVSHDEVLTYGLLATVSSAIAVLAARTGHSIIEGTFLGQGSSDVSVAAQPVPTLTSVTPQPLRSPAIFTSETPTHLDPAPTDSPPEVGSP